MKKLELEPDGIISDDNTFSLQFFKGVRVYCLGEGGVPLMGGKGTTRVNRNVLKMLSEVVTKMNTTFVQIQLAYAP